MAVSTSPVLVILLLLLCNNPVCGRGRGSGRGNSDREVSAGRGSADATSSVKPPISQGTPPPENKISKPLVDISDLKPIESKDLDLSQHTTPPPKLADAPKEQGKVLLTGVFDPEGDIAANGASIQDAKPQWAVQETYDGLKSFILGFVEELMITVKGRLPCEPLKYVLSNTVWLVAFQATGLIIDFGADGKVLRSMSAAYPSRDIIGVGDQPDTKLPQNVKIFSTNNIPAASSAAIIHFSCQAFTCASSALQILSPILKPGSIIIFNKVVGYPNYMSGQLRVFYELMEGIPGLSFEIIGGRFINNIGLFCLSQRPRTETTCPTSVAIRLVESVAGRKREPGGHLQQKTMPIIAQMCPGNPSPDEVHIKRSVELNASITSVKSSFQSQVSSLVIDRQQHDKNQEKSLATVRLLNTRVTELEGTVQMMLTVTVGLAAVVAILIYRIAWTYQKRQQFLR